MRYFSNEKIIMFNLEIIVLGILSQAEVSSLSNFKAKYVCFNACVT
jgi:hypothetical protein